MTWTFRHAALAAAFCMGCAAAPPAGPPAPVELAAGGLRIVPAKSGTPRLIAFGAPAPPPARRRAPPPPRRRGRRPPPPPPPPPAGKKRGPPPRNAITAYTPS